MQKALIIIALLLIFCVSPADAATWWIAESAAGSGDGSSFANRMSRSNYNGGSLSPSAGDTIVLHGEFDGTVTIQDSGTSGNPMTFDGDADSYDGSATDGFFDFDFSTLGSSSGAIFMRDKSYIDIKNIDFEGGNADWSDVGASRDTSAIKIEGDTGSPGHINIDNCSFHETIGGILIFSDDVAYSDIAITRCTFEDLCGAGVKTYNTSSARMQNFSVGSTTTGYGNTFHNVGQWCSYNDYRVSGAVQFDGVNNAIIARNRVYCDDDVDYGQVTVQLNDCQYVLIERNIFDNNWNTDNHRTAVSIKGDMSPFSSDTEGPTIIRYNVFRDYFTDYGYHNGSPSTYYGSWGGTTGSITCGYDHVGLYVYANMLTNANYISVNIGSEASYATNGQDNENSYVFSNVVSTTQTNGISLGGYSGSGRDDVENAYIFNNTIYWAATYDNSLGQTRDPFTSSIGYFAIRQPGYVRSTTGPFIKNNLIISPRPNRTSDSGVYNPEYRMLCLGGDGRATDTEEGYNHFYTYLNTASDRLAVRYNSSSGSFSGSITDTGRDYYIGNNTSGDPYVMDAENNDFRLTASTPSSVVSGGVDMGSGNIAQVTVQGTTHDIPWDFALGKDTVWSFTNPDSISIDEEAWDTIGSWGKGAYYYEAISPDTTAPTVQTVTITGASGDSLTVLLSETVTGNTGFTISPSGGAATLSNASNDGDEITFDISRSIEHDETVTWSVTSSNVQDAATNSLADDSGDVVNQSTYNAPTGSALGFTINGVAAEVNFAANVSVNWAHYPLGPTSGYDEDSDYKVAYLFEGDFTDSQGDENLTTLGGSAVPTFTSTSPFEGSQMAVFTRADNEYVYVNDADMAADNPLKASVGGAFTIYGRVSATYWDIEQRFFSKYLASSGNRGIEIASISGTGQIIVLRAYNSGDSYDSDTHGTALTDGNVYYFSYSEDASQNYRLRIYDVDASQVLGTDMTGTWSNGVYMGAVALSLGNRYNNSSSSAFGGNMDEIVVKAGADTTTEMDAWFARND
jgi:hypothetical protein